MVIAGRAPIASRGPGWGEGGGVRTTAPLGSDRISQINNTLDKNNAAPLLTATVAVAKLLLRLRLRLRRRCGSHSRAGKRGRCLGRAGAGPVCESRDVDRTVEPANGEVVARVHQLRGGAERAAVRNVEVGVPGATGRLVAKEGVAVAWIAVGRGHRQGQRARRTQLPEDKGEGREPHECLCKLRALARRGEACGRVGRRGSGRRICCHSRGRVPGSVKLRTVGEASCLGKCAVRAGQSAPLLASEVMFHQASSKLGVWALSEPPHELPYWHEVNGRCPDQFCSPYWTATFAQRPDDVDIYCERGIQNREHTATKTGGLRVPWRGVISDTVSRVSG